MPRAKATGKARADGIAPDPIIVCGAPRSGTTYLQSVLSQHPDIFISRETRIFFWAFKMAVGLPRDPKQRFIHSYREEFEAAIVPWTRRFISDLYRDIGRGAYFWGDKYPNYAANRNLLRFIVRLYEGAKFIHLVRDGRDVAASLLQMEWAKEHGFEGAHRNWVRSVEHASEFGRKLPPSQYIEVRYEDLVGDGHTVLAELLDFIGAPAHEAVTAYLDKQKRSRARHSNPTRTQEQLDAGVSQWETLLGPEEQKRSLALLEPTLSEWGYGPNAANGASRSAKR
jgi:sulfotransferase family protein